MNHFEVADMVNTEYYMFVLCLPSEASKSYVIYLCFDQQIITKSLGSGCDHPTLRF